MTDKYATFNWEDPLNLNDNLSEEEIMVMDSARAYCADKLMPRILEANRNEICGPRNIPRNGRAWPAWPDH